MSSVRYSACIFETKSWENRVCAWGFGKSGERPSYRWCTALFIGYELGKTGPGVGSQRYGDVLGGIGDASRAAGEIDSSERVVPAAGSQCLPGADLEQR